MANTPKDKARCLKSMSYYWHVHTRTPVSYIGKNDEISLLLTTL